MGRNMSSRANKIIDFFLLQKAFYSNLTDKSMWLYIGVALVGIRDVVLWVIGVNINPGAAQKVVLDLRTVGILFIAALLMGLLDSLCFSYPIFDIIKHFKKRNDNISMTMGMSYSSLLTKVVKVYAVVNIIITPIDLLTYYTGHLSLVNNSIILAYITSLLSILTYFWFNGALTRGLCVIFKLPNGVRGLVFVLVFLWNALLMAAIGYLFDKLILFL